jgi:hypothetical protein
LEGLRFFCVEGAKEEEEKRDFIREETHAEARRNAKGRKRNP